MALSIALKNCFLKYPPQSVRVAAVLHISKFNYAKDHPETPEFPDEYSLTPQKGTIFDKKPFRIELQADKLYSWCACGQSHNQPFCDGTHKTLWGTHEKKTVPKWRPHRFKVEETKEYWLCNCKQTDNRPFCDGTHKNEEIQAKIKT
ncbi:hypothetical protein SNE40_023110 [Patella caerulea]